MDPKHAAPPCLPAPLLALLPLAVISASRLPRSLHQSFGFPTDGVLKPPLSALFRSSITLMQMRGKKQANTFNHAPTGTRIDRQRETSSAVGVNKHTYTQTGSGTQ